MALCVLFLFVISFVKSQKHATTLKESLHRMIESSPSLIKHGATMKFDKFKAKYLGKFNNVIPCAKSTDIEDIMVLVHGRNGWYTDFNGLVNNFGSSYNKGVLTIGKTYYVCSVILGNTGETSVNDDLETLHKELEIFQDKRIILIAHSTLRSSLASYSASLHKGGLIVTRYIITYNDTRIVKIITISSPLKGTKVVDAIPFQSSRIYDDFSYNNEKSLQTESLIIKKNVEIYHVAPTKDHLLIPSDTGYYSSTPKENIYLYEGTEFSHAGILDNPEVANYILKWIN